MLNKLKKSDAKGFTIIEVMIVLAIVGLIILIVFLAVPALQRNSRNTQRKSDIGRLGSAATTVISNLNGANVTTANFSGGATGSLTAEAGTLGYYQSANVVTTVLASGGTTTLSPAGGVNATDFVRVVYNGTCNGTNNTASYKNRSVAILYNVETGGNAATGQTVCVDQ